MAQFSIKPGNAQKTVTDEEKFIRELAGFEDEIHRINNSLGFRVTSSAQIRSRLNSAADRVGGYQSRMSSMRSALSEVVNVYSSTENAIIGNLNVGNAKISVESGGNHEANDKFDWVSPFWDLVGSVGVVGGAIGTLGEFLTSSKVPGARWSELFKDTWNTGWDIFDVVKTCRGDTSVNWVKEIFGLNTDTALKSINAEILSDIGGAQKFKSGFQAGIMDTLGDFKTGAGAVKQVGGIILSGAVNAFENKKEYEDGKISAGRAVAETLTETAVDWGKDLLIGAAVTAGFAAAGIAAPAVAVGAATVAVSVAADWVCEKVCGKKLTEAVSDAILDGAEKVVDGFMTGAKEVKKGVDAFWKSAASGWNAFTGSLGAAFA